MSRFKRFLPLLTALIVSLSIFSGCNLTQDVPADLTSANNTTVQATVQTTAELTSAAQSEKTEAYNEDGVYTAKDDVAAYLHIYKRLPQNFITKNDARALGWNGGSLEPYAPGMCIGGDRYGNYEKLLPEQYRYRECDIDTLFASSRGAKRLVFAEDCSLIYYTGDHYETFTLLYGDEQN